MRLMNEIDLDLVIDKIMIVWDCPNITQLQPNRLAGFVTPPTDALYHGERMSIVGDEGAPSSGWGTVSNHDELMSNFFAQVSQHHDGF